MDSFAGLTPGAGNDTLIVLVILAIDPGTVRIGYALVDNRGKAVTQGIVNLDEGLGRLGQLAEARVVRTVVIGDGTNQMNIRAEIERLLPEVPVAVVGEKSSTVDAWQLKIEQEAGRNPFRRAWLMLVQLFNPPAVDDYAALVLARRYLAGRPGSGAGGSG